MSFFSLIFKSIYWKCKEAQSGAILLSVIQGGISNNVPGVMGKVNKSMFEVLEEYQGKK